MGVLDTLDTSRLRPGWQTGAPVAPTAPVSGVSGALRDLCNQRLEERAPEQYAEIKRICALPFLTPVTPEEAEVVSRREVLAPAYSSGFRLWPVQAASVLTWDSLGGLFAPIGVGFGKTLITLMLAQRAWRSGKKKTLLLIPSAVMKQLLGTKQAVGMLALARGKVPIEYPVHPVSGTPKARTATLKSGWPGLYVTSYELLSRSKTCPISLLEPEAIICDEAHALKKLKGSARAKRFMRYVNDAKPQCAFLSGTITGKGILEYWHLIKAALGEGCPLPLTFQMVEEWARVVDSNAAPSEAETGPLRPMVDWAMDNDPNNHERYVFSVQGFRAAYKLRLTSTPGVVATGDADIGTSLILVNSPVQVDEEREDVQEMIRLVEQVRDEWVTPAGDEIEHAIHTYKWMYELSAGFYNELYWPTAEALAERTSQSVAQCEESLGAAKLHHKAINDYHKALRGWLMDNHQPGLDTPLLVASHMARKGSFPDPLIYDLWSTAKSLEFEHMPERWGRVIRVCDYKVQHAVEWCQQHAKKSGAIVWYYHKGVGDWLHERLKAEFGDRVVFCPAGENEKVLDQKNKNKILVCSVSAHGTGKNLQHFQRQLYVQWPRAAILAEQSLGRTHRNGQQADELHVFRNDTTEFDAANFAACLNDAVYIHQSTGLRQKLVYATYDPLPRVYPSEWLHERGFGVKRLSPEQRALMADKFGA